MRAIALSTRYIARASAAATSRAASSEATLDRSSLQTVNGLEELWETMEEGGHSVYFSDRVTRKLAAMEKDQAEWVGEAEDEIARLLEIPPEFVGRARLRYGYTDLQEAKPSWDYEHPVNWKVTLSVKIAALDLAEAARDDLIAMLGPRYDTQSDTCRIVARKYRSRVFNRIHARVTLDALLAFAEDPSAATEAVSKAMGALEEFAVVE